VYFAKKVGSPPHLVQAELFRAMNPSPENAAVLICPKRVSHSGKQQVVLLLILAISRENGEQKWG
jgi:hypothetical protein